MTSEQAEQANLGKYKIPPTMMKLLTLENKLSQKNKSLDDVLGFYVRTDLIPYFNTPMDVVSFGSTGVDGEHYGFLTDFGSASDLENAPIVFVAPMNFDQPAIVVANNFREFIRIVMIDASLLNMDFENGAAYRKQKNEWEQQELKLGYTESEEEKSSKEDILRQIEAAIKPPTIADPYSYSAHAAKERAKRVTIFTQDGLGVVNKDVLNSGKAPAVFHVEKDVEIDLHALKSILNQLPTLRSLQHFVISSFNIF